MTYSVYKDCSKFSNQEYLYYLLIDRDMNINKILIDYSDFRDNISLRYGDTSVEGEYGKTLLRKHNLTIEYVNDVLILFNRIKLIYDNVERFGKLSEEKQTIIRLML